MANYRIMPDKSIKVVISGQTPSQKNNKQILHNHKTGKPFISSSDRVKKWQNKSLHELKYFNYKVNGRVQIDYMFYVENDVQRDIDNMVATVNDVLQKANADITVKNGRERFVPGTGIIEGDHWQKLRLGSADAEIDKSNPRAEMIITPIDSII